MRPDTMLTKLAAAMRCFALPRLRWLVGLAVTLPAQGCIHDILNVTDPDIVTEETLRANTPVGSMALHSGTIFRLAEATAGTGTGAGADPLFLFGGLITYERLSGDTCIQRNAAVPRSLDVSKSFH